MRWQSTNYIGQSILADIADMSVICANMETVFIYNAENNI